MEAGRAEPGVVGCHDDVALGDQLLDLGDLPGASIALQRRRTPRHDARGAVRPSDDRPASRGRRARRRDDDARHCDRLFVESRRDVEHACHRGSVRERRERLGPDDGTGLRVGQWPGRRVEARRRVGLGEPSDRGPRDDEDDDDAAEDQRPAPMPLAHCCSLSAHSFAHRSRGCNALPSFAPMSLSS